MKKIISAILMTIVLSGSVFANFFSNRYFEIVVNAPFGVSNNTINILDYLFQEEVVIDLTEFADTMPEKGFGISAYANPSVATNFYFPHFDLGLKVGANTSVYSSISKDLFDFICKGNEDENLQVEGTAEGDAFAFFEANLGFKNNKVKFSIVPSIFVPVAHVVCKDAVVTLKNPGEDSEDEGKIIYDLAGSVNMYSIYNLKDTDDILSNALGSIGFDLGGTVEFSLFDFMDLGASIRVPVVPGRFTYQNTREFSMHAETDIQTIAGGNMYDEETYKEFEFPEGEWEETEYYINRPLKMAMKASFKPMGNFLTTTVGGGLGIRNPFAHDQEEVSVYPEYYFGTKISLADVFAASLSTEYTDQIFSHQLGIVTNLRFVELDLGVSLQSDSFANSFSVSGLGGFATVIIGF